MPEQNEKNLPKAPAFNPKVKETIAAFKENNNPKNLNDILNELVRSPLLAPAVFDLQGQPAPKPEADGRVQLPKETKISLVMVTSPEGKRYYLGFSDWDAVHEWQKAQPKAAQQIILLRFDDYANMIAKNAEAFMAAGADIILLPAPGTVPGITQEYAHRLIEVVHSRGKLALTAIGTSQEGADVATICQIALMCKMAGADIHHIGDTGVPGMALPQNIMAYSIAIRGERHTYHKMAQSVNR